MPRKKQPRYDQPEGPAIIRSNHAQVRPISPIAGAPKGWRNLSEVEKAHAKGQLRGGSDKYSADQRLKAGMDYSGLFLTANGAGGRDSTQALNISQSAKGFSHPQSQQDAIYTLARIETQMGARDCRIIRKVCGEGHKPVDAIREVCAGYRDEVAQRFRESLDVLIEAFEANRRQRGDA